MSKTVKAAQFWDKVADGYAKRPVSDPEGYEKTLARTRDYLSEGDSVLELGCGTGTTALKLAPGIAKYRATDVSGKMIEIARAKPALIPVDFEQAGFDDAGRDSEYDAILAFNLLHLVSDLDQALTEVSKRTKPGGVFISKTMCKLGSSAPIKWRIMMIALPLFQAIGKAPPLVFRTADDYARAFAKAGFETEATEVHAKDLPHTFFVARKTV